MHRDARPNFVVLFADDHRYESAGIHGNAEVATMRADCRHVSVLDYSRGLGHTESLTIANQ